MSSCAIIIQDAEWKNRKRIYTIPWRSIEDKPHHRYPVYDVVPRARDAVARGWVKDPLKCTRTARTMAFKVIMHIANVGCVEAAHQSDLKRYKFPPRTAPFCLQEYILRVSMLVLQVDATENGDWLLVTQSNYCDDLDFGFAMQHTYEPPQQFDCHPATILGFLQNSKVYEKTRNKAPTPRNINAPTLTSPGVLQFLKLNRIIQTHLLDLAGLSDGKLVLDMHDTRPLIEEHAKSSIYRMRFDVPKQKVRPLTPRSKRKQSPVKLKEYVYNTPPAKRMKVPHRSQFQTPQPQQDHSFLTHKDGKSGLL